MVKRNDAHFLEGCWLQMASCSPASISILCHSSSDLTGNPAIRIPAFLVSRRLVFELASPSRESESEREMGVRRILTGIISIKFVEITDLKQKKMVWILFLYSLKLGHEACSTCQC